MAGGKEFVVSILLKATDLASPILGGVGKEARELGGAVKGLGPNAGAMGAAMSVAGGVVVGSLVAQAKAAAEYGGQLIDMSARTGASVEKLQEFGFAAQQTGADLGAVETGLKFVSRAQQDALAGGDAQVAAFQRLGFSIEQIRGMDAQTLFEQVGGALRGVQSDTERTDLAVQMFGRSGTNLIPMFTDAGSTLAQFQQTARDTGLVMSGETAAAMDEAGDKIDASMARIKMSGTTMGAAVAPVLADIVEDIAGIVGGITKWANENPALAETLGKVTLAGGGLMGVVGPMLMALPSLSAGWKLVAENLTLTNIAAKGTAIAGWAKAAWGAVTASYAWATANVAVAVSFSPILVALAALAAALIAGILIWKEYHMWADTKRLNKQSKETEKRSNEMAAERGWTRKKDGTIVKPEGRASGGPVRAGVPVWVGENGKELMVPAYDAMIVPESKIAAATQARASGAGPFGALGAGGGQGGRTVVVNVQGPALGDGGLRRMLYDIMDEYMEARGFQGMALGTA